MVVGEESRVESSRACRLVKSVYTEIEQTFKKNDNFFMIEKKIGHIETGPNIFSNIFCILIHIKYSTF